MKSDTERRETACAGTPIPLAGSGVGRVIACSCGNIHVDVEYVTLRFAPEAFGELAAMLSQAQDRLDGHHLAPDAFDAKAVH